MKKNTIALITAVLSTASKANGINYRLEKETKGWTVKADTGKRGRKASQSFFKKDQLEQFATSLLTMPFYKARKGVKTSTRNKTGVTIENVAPAIEHYIRVQMGSEVGTGKNKVWYVFHPKCGLYFIRNGKRVSNRSYTINEIQVKLEDHLLNKKIKSNRFIATV